MKKTISGSALYGRKIPSGFTIVELLIVIVVIAILAAISIVAYSGIQDRANSTTVQSDISNMAKKIELYKAEFGTIPSSSWGTEQASLRTVLSGFTVSKGAYGDGFENGGGFHNLLYCRSNDNTTYGVVAWSKASSSSGFAILNGASQVFAYAPAGHATTCPRLDGISVSAYTGIWLRHESVWRAGT